MADDVADGYFDGLVDKYGNATPYGQQLLDQHKAYRTGSGIKYIVGNGGGPAPGSENANGFASSGQTVPGSTPAATTPPPGSYSPNNVYWTKNGIIAYVSTYDPASNSYKYTWQNFGQDANAAATASGIPIDVLNQIIQTQKETQAHYDTAKVPNPQDITYDPTTGKSFLAQHDDPLSPNKITGYQDLGAFGNGLKADYVTNPVTTNMTPPAPVPPSPTGTNAFGSPSGGTGAFDSHAGASAGAATGGTPGATPGATPGGHAGATATATDPTGGVPGTSPTTGTTPGSHTAGSSGQGAAGTGSTTNGPGMFDWGSQSGSAWTFGELPAGSESQLDSMAASTGIPKELLRKQMLDQVTQAQQTLINNDRMQRQSQSRSLTGVGRTNAGFTPIGF